MAKMGSYCKAYPIEKLREFTKWEQNAKLNLAGGGGAEGDDSEEESHPFKGRYLFLQDNFTVTEGVFIDEQIVFDKITEDWKKFCTDALQFEIPAFCITQPKNSAAE